MKQAVFIRRVAGASRLTTDQVKRALRAMQDVSAEGLKEDGSIRIPGIVTMKRHEVASRMHRVPNLPDPYVLPAATVLKAKPNPAFCRRVKQENPISV